MFIHIDTHRYTQDMCKQSNETTINFTQHKLMSNETTSWTRPILDSQLINLGVAPMAQLAKGRLSDAGGLRFESQAGRVTGKSIPSLWRDQHPAIKSLRPAEHHVDQFHPDREDSPESTKTTSWTRPLPDSWPFDVYQGEPLVQHSCTGFTIISTTYGSTQTHILDDCSAAHVVMLFLFK